MNATRKLRSSPPAVGHLRELVPWKKWIAEHGPPVFPTPASFEWYLRMHPDLRDGPGWYELPQGNFIGPGFEQELMRSLGLPSKSKETTS